MRSSTVLAALVGTALSVGASQAPAPGRPQTVAPLDVVQLRSDFFVMAGAGGNVGVQVGADGAIVVDSGSAARAEDLVAAIKRVSPRPIRYVINTGPDAEHVGGNDVVAKAGQTLFSLNFTPGVSTLAGLTNGGAASVLSAEGVLRRMSAPTGQVAPFPTSAWPTETFDGRRSYMYLNGQGIETLHQPAAHTDSDSIVFFRRSDIVMAGDILDATRFPVIDVTRGGSVQGEIAALEKLVELAIPAFPLVWQEGGTYVVPGHGHVYQQLDVVEYRDMVTIIRDRVRALMDEKRTLDQVKAARPARGFSRQYGSDTGPWTTDMFIEAVYRSLQREKGQ